MKLIKLMSLLMTMRVTLGTELRYDRVPMASRQQLELSVETFCEAFYNEKLPFDTPYELIYSKSERCIENYFGGKDSKLPLPSKTVHWCRAGHEMRFSVKPLSHHWQLVILVPEQEDYLIDFQLLKPNESKGRLDLPETKATFWTTVLNEDGTSSLWLRGPTIPRKGVDCSDSKITVNFEDPTFNYKPGTQLVHATFNWSFSSEPESSFQVTNYCYVEDWLEGNYTTMSLGPNVVSITLSDLLIDTGCNFTISLGGKKIQYSYDTPPCSEFADCKIPEQPTNITVDTTETFDGSAWDVEVSWAPPARKPEQYNVTFFAEGLHNVVVSGNATRVNFFNVKGDRVYIAYVDAVGHGFRKGKMVKEYFPEKAHTHSSIVWVVAGAWCVTVALSTVAWLVALWKRRRNHPFKHLYFQPGVIPAKLSKQWSFDSGRDSGVEDAWEVPSERLQLHEVIGEGAFGVVRRGTMAPGGKDVAVKMLKDFPTPEEIRSFHSEMELMKSVGVHPHIVSLVGCNSGQRPLIISEYCSRGDLLSYLRCCWDLLVSKRNAKYYNHLESSDYRNDLFKTPQKDSNLVVNKMYEMKGICDTELTSADLLSFCRQIAMGMEFLALNRVVHRDLAARNVLVTSDRTLKIADFGLSRDVYQENQYRQKGNGKMPVKWMALESLTHRIYTTQSDVWSFGVVVWEVVTVGASPYPHVCATRLPRLLRSGYRMPKPHNCSKPLYDLMLSCWSARPRDRPTFGELHRRLDELLKDACAEDYLSLELDHDEVVYKSRAHKYIMMILSPLLPREKAYARPLKPPPSNKYTCPTVTLPKEMIDL